MIYELVRNDFKNLIHLDKYYNVEISAIISGYNTGKIYADSSTNPRSAIICTKDGSFFIGDTNNKSFNNSINEFINSTIKPMLKSLEIESLYICSVSKEWDKKIEQLFGYRRLSKSNQFVFRLNNIDEKILDINEQLDNIKVCKASKEFFEYPYENRDYFIKDILRFWDNLDEFCDKGFGVFLTRNNRILSRCTLDFKYKNICTIGVSTDENNRKCGYAKRAVSEMLRYCKENRLDPYWDCMESNKGSIALAKSVGFIKDYTYSLYAFDL